MSDLGVAVVIEDDADVRNLLQSVLLQAGFVVHIASDGRMGVDVAREKQPDVVTLDIGLPDIDGFEVLRRIRQFSGAYVVMLTGRTDEPDLLTALQGGADDYITKPFRPLELRARISAMMRRPRQDSSADLAAEKRTAANTPGLLRHNGLALNARSRTAVLGGAPVELTRSEFDLLHELMRGAGAVKSRSELVRVVRGDYYGDNDYVSEADERAVEVHIGNLRRKLRDNREDPRWLQTVRGVGYRLPPTRPEQVEGPS
ncbi:two-component system response regulator [Arthrobacter sp. Leaf337]|uniref:response regulator transcription factor n=1 Tax=Arthrobacter sp. Leaf337 TaxID=1736342 RepID=UPI0006F8F3E6|nr:response regulator transcription factor [Arthrobacter sp. Leaf337]KQR65611.1 two-component system response regulator [Arthrobacter sp. Leaf337]